ncbi:MAG: CBS domain-containing protein [Armatimonadetes bacterium]|nr:CBS domain-containing protein [Armatimonadota bacterium]
MKAKEIMTTPVLAIEETDRAQHAVEIMADNDISGLPVVNGREELVGIVTERDLLLLERQQPPMMKTALYGLWITPQHLIEQDAEWRGLEVKDVMTRKVVTFGPEDKVIDIAKAMHDKGINRVPIVDGGKIVGIISRKDIIRAMAKGLSLE